MVSTDLSKGAWHPKTESDKQIVRSQLERIVSDERFTASKRYPGLLRYVVEQTLAGNEDSLKERTLGVEVFHRPPDYDTNLDPVVRLSAGEVRKRLAQYYQASAHEGELKILLNPGSYVPLFWPAAVESPVLKPVEADKTPTVEAVSLPAESPARRITARGIHRPKILIALSALILAILALGTQSWRLSGRRRSALDDVWAPLVSSNKPILFCVGGIASVPQDLPLVTELQSVADDASTLQMITSRNDFVPFSDVQTLSRFLYLAGTHGHPYSVQNFRTTVSSQLREGPVVLIGALNNDWTLNRTAPLRFHIEGPEGPNRVFWIEDREHPESRAWQVIAQAPRSNTVKDFAIAARFVDQSTGQVVLVAAGIAGIGTRAAGDFMTDEASLNQLASSAGVEWRKTSFEVVLSSEVVNGMQGKPKVEAKVFW